MLIRSYLPLSLFSISIILGHALADMESLPLHHVIYFGTLHFTFAISESRESYNFDMDLFPQKYN